MKRKIDITIDLKSKYLNTVYLKQMDTTVFFIKLIDDSVIVDLTSQIVDIIFTKPDNTIVQQMSSNIDFENGIAVIQLHEDCLRMSGKAKMEVEIKNTNSEVISSFYIPIQIEKTSKENINSSNTPNYYEEFSKAIDDFKEDSAQLLEDLSDSFYETIEEELKDTVIENSEEEISRYTQNKKVELDEYTQLKEEELTQVQNRYAKALKKKVESTEFIQIYSDNNKIEDLEISGEELRQETRSGEKNLLDSSTISIKTEGGITSIYNKNNNTITFNGTCTVSNTRFKFKDTSINCIKNATKLVAYYESGSITIPEGTSDDSNSLRLYDENWGSNTQIFLQELSSANFRIVKNCTVSYTSINNDVRFSVGTILNNFTIKVMVTNNENTEFEPYGASPSPEYPSEIESDGSNENLFDGELESGSINTSGQLISQATAIRTKNYIKVIAGQTYSISTMYAINNTTMIRCYSSSHDFISSVTGLAANQLTNSFVIPIGVSYIKFVQFDCNDITKKYKIERGLIVTPYSSYGCRSFEIEDIGKNFINFQNVKGIAVNAANTIRYGLRYEGLNGNYTLSAKRVANNFYYKKILNGTTYDSARQLSNITSGFRTINLTPSDVLLIYADTQEVFLSSDELMLEKSETATEYEPHQSTTSLINFPATEIIGSMNGAENEIKKIDGLWKIEKNIKEWIFDGNETWNKSATTAVDRFWTRSIEDVKYQSYIECLCTHGKNSNQDTTEIGRIYFAVYDVSHQNRFFINFSQYGTTTVEQFKAWLAQKYAEGNPMKLAYQLAEPEYITLPEETQEVLNNLEIMYGINNISILNNGKISFTYNQEISRALAERDERIERLEQLLSEN